MPAEPSARFCKECGTLLTHDGVRWRCARCQTEGFVIVLGNPPSLGGMS